MVIHFKLNFCNAENTVMIKLRETRDIYFVESKQRQCFAYKNVMKETILQNK